HELAEAVHAGLPLTEGVPGDGGGDAGEVIAHGEHLATSFADGEELPRLVAVAADRALDVGDEARRANAPSPSRPWRRSPPCRRGGPALPRSGRTPWSSRRGPPSSTAGSIRR